MATTHIKRSASASRLVNYAEKRAVLKDGLNLDVNYAKSQFKQVREAYGNQGKTQAYASRISFSPKEFDPKNEIDQKKALDIAKEVYQKTYPNQQVALYEHADTDALHIHAVIGAIDLETGKKMHGNWQEYREKLVHNTDEIVQKHGLEVTQVDPERYEKRSMAEIKMHDRGQPTWKDQIRQAVDSTMSNQLIHDFQTFRDDLKQKAIDVWERGKDLTYQLTGFIGMKDKGGWREDLKECHKEHLLHHGPIWSFTKQEDEQVKSAIKSFRTLFERSIHSR